MYNIPRKTEYSWLQKAQLEIQSQFDKIDSTDNNEPQNKPKKGDLTSLKNWRPISLINCDAKVFTRILNGRLANVIGNIIQPYQTGFMPGRFIGDNGVLLHFILQQARSTQHPGIGLLLDQEKAYDRVHPVYLRQVLAKFNISPTFINCIMSLFFGNNVQVNVNGFFSSSVSQKRGLRQGDPLSPFLFNLALEPLLLLIQQDNSIKGYEYQNLENRTSCIKLLASKPEVFTLTGRPLNDTWKEVLAQQQITNTHDNTSPTGFRYLGFTMTFTAAQRNSTELVLLQQIKDTISFYSTRKLSRKGRKIILNTLILNSWSPLRSGINSYRPHIEISIAAPLNTIPFGKSITSSYKIGSGTSLCFYQPVICGIVCYVERFLLGSTFILSAVKNVPHVLFALTKKFYIWRTVLGSLVPWLSFTPTDIVETLTTLSIPFDIPQSLHNSYLVLASTTQFIIWKVYWRSVFDNIPFDSEHIISEIQTTFHILTL
ncbi:hypothetical protein [Parasitella parasitica]|uniref:Reverse transcriptase domain-containing protein n=1 Tax=Parasitella parasitica TaxID=35722 RepID=A0A0B7N364_9FUNG|nr:hypothetical protein [Parasitella parasitica]